MCSMSRNIKNVTQNIISLFLNFVINHAHNSKYFFAPQQRQLYEKKHVAQFLNANFFDYYLTLLVIIQLSVRTCIHRIQILNTAINVYILTLHKSQNQLFSLFSIFSNNIKQCCPEQHLYWKQSINSVITFSIVWYKELVNLKAVILHFYVEWKPT